jgi:hypothetical protein
MVDLSSFFVEYVRLNQVFATFLRSAQSLGIKISTEDNNDESSENDEEAFQQFLNRVEELGGLGFSLAVRESFKGMSIGSLTLVTVRMLLKDMIGLAPYLIEVKFSFVVQVFFTEISIISY